MILAIDIGNTSTDVALFAGDRILTRTHGTTSVLLSPAAVGEWLEGIAVDWPEVVGAAFCTVVRPARQAWTQALSSRGLKVMEVTSETTTTLRSEYADPAQLGVDRCLAALAAFERHGGPVVVVNAGTAITVDAVSADGVFLGGAIAPGIAAGRSALASYCDQLPEVEVREPPGALARDTDSAVRAGLVFGAAGAIRELAARAAQEAAIEPRLVIAGGDAELVAPHLDHVIAVDPALVLHGLRIVWEQNTEAPGR
jgi:type III pantothenate kinase